MCIRDRAEVDVELQQLDPAWTLSHVEKGRNTVGRTAEENQGPSFSSQRRMSTERRYAVRFRLGSGDVAELPYIASERVRAGQQITVFGWRVSVESVAAEATAHTSGLLTGYLVRTARALGPNHVR